MPNDARARFVELTRQYESWKARFRAAETDPEKEEILSMMGMVLAQLFTVVRELKEQGLRPPPPDPRRN